MAFLDTSATGRTPGVGRGGRARIATSSRAVLNQGPLRNVWTVAPVLEVVVDNTAGGPSDVEYQVSTSSAFGTTAFTTTLTSVANGPSNVLASGLTLGTVYYWRARAADAGTTGWGPWSGDALGAAITPWSFKYDAEFSTAVAYLTENVGAGDQVVFQAVAYLTENVGFQIVLSAQAVEYLHENVGFEIVLSSQAVLYGYLGDVNSLTPVPHLWFLHKPYGFAGDEIWAFGHGFGNPQSEFTALMRFDPGPDYGTADVTLGVNEWYEEIAGPDAYTVDRQIYPGTFDIDPVLTVEHNVVRFEVPSGIMPDGDATIHKAYITHTGGTSNKVDWLMYPTIPISAGNVRHNVSTKTVVRLSADFGDNGIEQLWFYTDQPEYVITDGLPQRPPTFTTTATTVAQLGAWSTEAALAAALDVDLGATHRWLPDEDSLTPRPDLGTGVTVWDASVGATTKGWRLDLETAPYIDPAYTIPSRQGDLALPAMIFSGATYGELTGLVASGPAYTIAMVAVLHSPPSGRGTLYSTFRTGVPDPDFYDTELYYEGRLLRLGSGGTYGRRNLYVPRGRPVIIVHTVDVDTSQIIIVDDLPGSKVTSGLQMQAANNHVYLGRSWRIDDEIALASMDVLDLAWWDAALSPADAWSVANKLDGIYGVTR